MGQGSFRAAAPCGRRGRFVIRAREEVGFGYSTPPPTNQRANTYLRDSISIDFIDPTPRQEAGVCSPIGILTEPCRWHRSGWGSVHPGLAASPAFGACSGSDLLERMRFVFQSARRAASAGSAAGHSRRQTATAARPGWRDQEGRLGSCPESDSRISPECQYGNRMEFLVDWNRQTGQVYYFANSIFT